MRIDAVIGHKPGQRGAVIVEKTLLNDVRVGIRNTQQSGNVGSHFRVDKIEKCAFRRI